MRSNKDNFNKEVPTAKALLIQDQLGLYIYDCEDLLREKIRQLYQRNPMIPMELIDCFLDAYELKEVNTMKDWYVKEVHPLIDKRKRSLRSGKVTREEEAALEKINELFKK